MRHISQLRLHRQLMGCSMQLVVSGWDSLVGYYEVRDNIKNAVQVADISTTMHGLTSFVRIYQGRFVRDIKEEECDT